MSEAARSIRENSPRGDTQGALDSQPHLRAIFPPECSTVTVTKKGAPSEVDPTDDNSESSEAPAAA